MSMVIAMLLSLFSFNLFPAAEYRDARPSAALSEHVAQVDTVTVPSFGIRTPNFPHK